LPPPGLQFGGGQEVEIMANRKALSKGEKILLFVTSALVVVIGAIGYGFYSININPVVSVPTPAMPDPNALDIYLAAHKLKVSSIPTPAGPASELTVEDTVSCVQGGKLIPKSGSAKPPRLADMQALMAKNAPVLAKARQGFSREYHEIPCRSFNTLFPHMAPMRDMARIMLADGSVKCASGDWDTGAERFLDVMRLGNDSPRGGVMISMLVGVAIQAIGRREVWVTLDHVSGAEAHHAARRLEEMAARRVPYADTLHEEKWYVQASLLEMFKDSAWRKSPFISMLAEGENENWYTALNMMIASKRAIMRNYTMYMDALIANAEKPYPANLKSPPLPSDLFCQMLLPVYDKAWVKYAVGGTQNDLLTVSFALRAYKAEHGKYPADLKALTPAYLKEIPTDIFTVGKPLSYKMIGKSCVLYSVGPDGKDDGGIPSADGIDARLSTRVTKNTYLTQKSQDDIVAGVNVH